MQGLGVKKKNWKVCNKNGNYRTQVTRVPTDLGMTVRNGHFDFNIYKY